MAQSGLSRSWSTPNDGTVLDYVVDDVGVTLATDTGIVRTLSAEDGSELGRAEFSEPVYPYGLAVDGQWVAVVLEDDRLYVLDRDSFTVQRQFPLSDGFTGAAARNGSVFIATNAGIQNISLSDGTIEWTDEGGPSGPVWLTSQGVLVNRGDLFLYDDRTGEVHWSVGRGSWAGRPSDWLEDSWFNGLVETESYFVTAVPSSGYEVNDKYTGETIWEAGGSGRVNRVAANDELTAYQDGSSIVCRTTENGEKRWQTEFSIHAKAMTLLGDTLLLSGRHPDGDSDVMMALDPATREVEWESPSEGPIGLFTRTGDSLYAVNLRTDAVQAYSVSGNEPLDGDSSTPSVGVDGDGGTESSDTGTDDGRQEGGEEVEGEKLETDRASIQLSGQRTAVPVGEQARLTLSVVNFVTSEQMTVQLVLELPSGVEVAAVDGADQGSNQLTYDTTVDRGDEANIEIDLRINEPGNHDVVGQAIYYFGGNQGDGRVYRQQMTIEGTSGSGGATDVSDPASSMEEAESSDDSLDGGFTGVAAIGGLLGAGLLARAERSDD